MERPPHKLFWLKKITRLRFSLIGKLGKSCLKLHLLHNGLAVREYGQSHTMIKRC